jgi:aspartyl-tRNA(Asn)/glutamyl-tRNA(Gln) amidotransferase subunit C
MTLSRDDVDHVALLARIGLSDEEREHLGQQLTAIVAHVSELQKKDTSAVSPTAQVSGLVNVWREDEPAESLPADKALANAPRREGDYFVVGAIQE